MKKYKAVITDFDQTIADTGKLIEDCLYSNAERFGYKLDRKILRNGIGMTAEAIYLDAGVSDEQAHMLDCVYNDYSAEIMCEKTGFFPGVAKSFELLRGREILLAVLSLKAADQIWGPLKHHGLDKYIHSVLGQGDMARGKPDPEGIFILSEKMGVALDDILYVGDSMTDMKTAQNAGVDFAAVCAGTTSADDFAAEGAKMIYPTFAEMCRDLSTLFAQN